MTEKSTHNHWLDRTLMYGFLGLIVGTALSGGIVTPWASALFALAVIVLLVLFALRIITAQNFELFIPATIWPFLALIILGLVQSYAWTDQAGVRQSLSVDVEATRSILLLLVILCGAFLLGANIFRRSKAQKILGNFLVFYGLGFAFLALILYLTRKQNINWLPFHENSNAFGTFINRNHFAGYIELLFPLPVALLLVLREELEQKMLYIAAAAMMGVALCFSLSRGGMISLGVQLLFLSAINSQRTNTTNPKAQKKARRIRALSISGIVVLICTGIFMLGANPVILRFGDDDSRAEIWANAWRIVQAHPVLGAGLGTFETAFPLYAIDKGSDVAAEAHSDYLQILTDAGLTGGTIFLLFLYLLARHIGQALRTGSARQRALALGCSTSIIGLLVHSFFDFNLQLPSHSLLYLLHCALCAEIAAHNFQPVTTARTAPAYQVLSFRKGSS